jgi:flagellar motor protein MotB
MNRLFGYLWPGIYAVVAAIALAIVISKIATREHNFFTKELATQNSKIQKVADSLETTAGDLTLLDTGLQNTAHTLIQIQKQISSNNVGAAIAQLESKINQANRTLDDIKSVTSPNSAKTALAPLDAKIDKANKILAEVKAALQRANGAQTGRAAFEFLNIVHDTGSAAYQAAQGLAAKQKVLDAAKDVALNFANSFAGGAGHQLGDAVGKWIACSTIECKEEQQEKVIEIVSNAPPQSCGKDCQAFLTKLDDATYNLALARIEAAVTGFKDEMANKASEAKLVDANAMLDGALKSLAKIKDVIDRLKAGAGADSGKLDEVSKSLATLDTAVKKGFADTSSAHAKLMNAIMKPALPPETGPTKSQQDLVVFYVSAPPAAPPPPNPPPMTVRFEKIGSIDDNGQTAVIIEKLRGIVKGRTDCSIAVSGHADTLGSDEANYTLSKKRAEEIAAKLKSAFGDRIPISETQWGERRLQEWTPDRTAREANRRVDIAVSCKG